MLLSKVAECWRLGNEKLGKYQEALLVAGLVVVAGVASVMLIRVLSASWIALLEGGTPGIPWEGGRPREPEFPPSLYKEADPGEHLTRRALRTPVPAMDWNDRRLSRRAASLLSLEGHLGDGLELLRPDDPEREKLLAITDLQHERVLRTLEEILPQEERLLLEIWQPATQRAGAGRQARQSMGERLRYWGEILPERLLFRFVVNLHCDVGERTGASDAHLKVLLESSFPPRSHARKLYVDSESLQRGPYRSRAAAP